MYVPVYCAHRGAPRAHRWADGWTGLGADALDNTPSTAKTSLAMRLTWLLVWCRRQSSFTENEVKW